MKEPKPTPQPFEEARLEIQEALGWMAAGLTVWIDRATDPHQPPREVVLRMLRQGEAALERLNEQYQRELAKERAETLKRLSDLIDPEKAEINVVWLLDRLEEISLEFERRAEGGK